jgi:polyphosphate kinase 2 (PPK2 family)
VSAAQKEMERGASGENKLKAEEYEPELRKLQTKLVEMQECVRATGAKIVLVFEAGDAADKGADLLALEDSHRDKRFCDGSSWLVGR